MNGKICLPTNANCNSFIVITPLTTLLPFTQAGPKSADCGAHCLHDLSSLELNDDYDHTSAELLSLICCSQSGYHTPCTSKSVE